METTRQYKVNLSPEQRTEKNRRQRAYYQKNRERILAKDALRRKLHPPKRRVPKQVKFEDNPEREDILRLIEMEKQAKQAHRCPHS